VNRGMLSAAVMLLATAIMGPVQADNVLQLKGTLVDPATCSNPLKGETFDGSAWFGYNSPIIENVNYTIEVGDWLEYEVLIPKESTLAGGGIDMRFSEKPRRALGPELRSAFVTDQYGLYPHPGTNYARLSTRTTETCGPDGKPVTTPLFQRGQWLKRQIDLSSLAVGESGDPVAINDVFVAIDKYDGLNFYPNCPDPANQTAVALFRNINIKNRDDQGKEVVKLAIYNGEAAMRTGKTSLTGDGLLTSGEATVTNASVSVLDDTVVTPSP
jgi:hypothetical protein